MPLKKISILKENEFDIATLNYCEQPPSINITFNNGETKTTSGNDIYECLGKIISDLPDICFLCKGAKINVRPSSMSSQMTSGVMAYEHRLGCRAKRRDVVNIFDYEDLDIISDPQLQTAFFFKWLNSLQD